jgi:hypothetical protein
MAVTPVMAGKKRITTVSSPLEKKEIDEPKMI